MKTTILKRRLGYIYLCCIPILTIFFAFVTGHISYKLYVPIWLLNFVLMGMAVGFLGANAFTGYDREKRQLLAAGCLLVLPICFLAILFGMGPPPDTREEWVATAVEQKIRFDILLAGGIFVALGLSLTKLILNERGEKLYAQLGHTAILIAIPVFLIVTSFWHSFALHAYKVRLESNTKQPQEWFAAMAQQIWILTICEILLTYFAIAMFARSLMLTQIFKRTPAFVYILFCTIAIISVLCFPLYPGSAPFSGFPYYPFMIPAIPIIICYYIGVNLIRYAGTRRD